MNIFGYEIKRKGSEPVSFVPKMNDEGALIVNEGGYFGTYIDVDGSIRSEAELINKYRDMAEYPEVDMAIDDIVNEIIIQEPEAKLVELILDDVPLSDKFKKILITEFEGVLNLLEFNSHAYDIVRRWFIDGRLYYHAIIDEKNPQFGVVEVRYIDPRKIRKIKETKKRRGDPNFPETQTDREYYMFNDKGFAKTSGNSSAPSQTIGGLKIAKDSIVHCTSGLLSSTDVVVSYLQKAVRPLNQLRSMEDALVIYRISRAPERRIFYIDVGNLPKAKAEEYVRSLMTKFKNKLVYDACLDMHTMIPLLDGRTLPLHEIAKEFAQGNELWSYSCDPITGKVSPGLITGARRTRVGEKVIRLTLDNGKQITCTYDHKFPTWNKGKTEAKDLEIGDSMIPHYTRNKPIPGGKSEYQQIFDNKSKTWIYTHRLVSMWKDSMNIENEFIFNNEYAEYKKQTVHHKNYDRYNNDPSNLTRMYNVDYLEYHRQHNSAAGKIGGKRSADLRREAGIPHFINLSKEQMIENGRRNGAIIGPKLYDEKRGFFGWSEEDRLEHNIKANKMLGEYLKNDPVFGQQFCEAQSAGWTDELRLAASERGKNRAEELTAYIKHGNIIRWEDPEQHTNASEIQSIIYTNEIISFVESLISQGTTNGVEICSLIESSTLVHEWRNINNVRPIKTWNPSRKFNVEDLGRIARKHGFTSWKPYRDSIRFKNHKIVNIEYLDETMDVGTLCIDGAEIYHDNHTFALDAGIYTCNSNGEIKDERRFQTMLEDFWLPRREGKGTEITTLPGGQNLSDLDDVLYFQKKLYKALNVPIGRLDSEQQFSFGRSQEISRDEIKFAKFINKLRAKFSSLFLKILEKQLILKGIVTPEEWDELKNAIKFKFNKDNYWDELMESEVLKDRLQTLQLLQPVIGITYSWEWVRRNVLKQTDDEIEEIDKQNEIERKNPLLFPSQEEFGPTNGQ